MKDTIVDNIIRSQHAEDYLDYFGCQDLDSIESLLSPECVLSDWNVGIVKGIENVMKVYSDIFNSVEKIDIDILHLYEDSDAIISEMIITMDEKVMPIVDVIKFDESDLLLSIKAYRGF
jgi:hypothetical protein